MEVDLSLGQERRGWACLSDVIGSDRSDRSDGILVGLSMFRRLRRKVYLLNIPSVEVFIFPGG